MTLMLIPIILLLSILVVIAEMVQAIEWATPAFEAVCLVGGLIIVGLNAKFNANKKFTWKTGRVVVLEILIFWSFAFAALWEVWSHKKEEWAIADKEKEAQIHQAMQRTDDPHRLTKALAIAQLASSKSQVLTLTTDALRAIATQDSNDELSPADITAGLQSLTPLQWQQDIDTGCKYPHYAELLVRQGGPADVAEHLRSLSSNTSKTCDSQVHYLQLVQQRCQSRWAGRCQSELPRQALEKGPYAVDLQQKIQKLLQRTHENFVPADSAPLSTLTNKAPKKYGMTWGVTNPVASKGVVGVSCHGTPKTESGSCDAYRGDTDCASKLPLLCLKKEGSPRPPDLKVSFYSGWTGGSLQLTEPAQGSKFGTRADADAFCVQTLGPGWRVAEHHDGIIDNNGAHGGWGFYGKGKLADTSRFWVAINSTYAVCWAPE